ncbi:carbohydrate ABC transporter permease [Haploplasma modicum]|jgi:multiple sugar transport system permease protein|uniref:carbohydrate ABC transporter permease n=1 Tax=Haploplasma modicum TaxID=2150 RepID=UPI000556A672|nr:carbohydrate ABC transporter permease [Haploplasma modicum]
MTNNKIDYRQNKRLVVQKTNKIIGKTITYSFLTIMALFVLIPFYWMFNVSLQSNNEVLNSISISYFPKEFSPDNYIKVFLYSSTSQGNITFMDYLKNTLIVAFFSTAAGTIFSILVAFALARLNFKGKDLIFTLLLATMMIPGEMMVLSNYVTVSRLGWVNDDGIGSYLAMIVPFTVSIFHIYLLRQNFKQIPDELYYAAKIDGSTDFKYLWQIMVPMAKSSIITITILKLMGSWNAYIWPNLVANSKYKLVTSWLRSSFVDEAEGGRVLMNYQMAATVIVTVPLLIFFVVFRKYIMSGVSRSGVKG